jgi:hypothetical protein
MKTFIFLLILIIAFFTYIFTANSNNSNSDNQNKQVRSVIQQQPTLEILEDSMSHESIEKPKIENIYSITNEDLPNPDMDSLYKSDTPSIPENMTFDKFKAVLIQINPYYPESAITLNLPLSSVIRTPKEKQLFRKKMKEDFHLSETQIDYLLKKNKLIWDWINLLR